MRCQEYPGQLCPHQQRDGYRGPSCWPCHMSCVEGAVLVIQRRQENSSVLVPCRLDGETQVTVTNDKAKRSQQSRQACC